MLTLMEKDLETIRQLEEEVRYWRNLYNETIEQDREQTKKRHWYN